MKKSINKKFRILLILCTPGLLVLAFIASMHITAGLSGLPGYRGGPQDAFRHALASAIVAKYISPSAVKYFTQMSEQNPSSDHDRMDIQNNKIGAKVGETASDLYQTVMILVKAGQINSTKADMITWLPQDRWKDFFN